MSEQTKMDNGPIPNNLYKTHDHMPEIELLRAGEVITARYLRKRDAGQSIYISVSRQQMMMDSVFEGKTWILQAEQAHFTDQGASIEWIYYTAEASKTLWG